MNSHDAPSEHGTAPPMRGPVLLAEDDPDMREVIANALRGDGYEVQEACDGFELWDLLATHFNEGSGRGHGLVISDIRMPGATGFEVLAALRTHDRSMPVVLTTAFRDSDTHAEADRLGAQLVLDKPFDLGKLRLVVRVLIGS